jgi:glycolate oxidase iron-sulfur subunit
VSAELPRASAATFALPGAELCVHCGFCLQACPTYLALEDENDSPRGRIVLMKAMADGQIPVTDPDAQRHLDQCLGCRGCETACPSGVPYGQLLEATREQITARRPLPFVARVILGVFARPAMLSLAMFGARVLRATGIPRLLAQMPGSPGFAMAMLASTSRSDVGHDVVAARPANATGPGAVATLDGCVMEGLFANANRATERTLVNNGYRLAAADGQRCCGALHAHAGDGDAARTLARANIAAFEASGAEFIGVNSAGCGAMMKEYGHLLHDDPAWRDRAAAVGAKVRDLSELLAAVGPKHGGMLAGAPKVAYDAPCHLQHGQRVTAPPMAVLNAIDGLRLVTLVDSDQCCGSAGIYNLIEPDVSNRVLEPKLARIAESGASIVVTGNPGCLMQIGAGLIRSGSAARAMHPVELLDASYRK